MSELPHKYKKLIAFGINISTNLPDLNNMTDRGAKPLKPWTASKTVGTMKMIRDFNIIDEENTFKEISMKTLTIENRKKVISWSISYRG